MIISHRWRFVFIKNRKVAGSAIELALRPHLGPEDIATPLLEDRLGETSTRPQNWERRIREWGVRDFRRFVLDRRRPDFKNHLPGPRIRQMVPSRVWDSYFKFAVERNPYDKVLSGYAWSNEIRQREGRAQLSLDSFVQGPSIYEYKDWHRYAEGHSLVVDRVLRFEELDTQLAEVAAMLGLPRFELPNAKAGIRKDRGSVFETLGDHVDRVSEVFEEELEILGA